MEGDSLAPPCQAEDDVIAAILDISNLTESSTLFDLGCGDGRICVAATEKFGCRSVGCEIEPKLIHNFRKRVQMLDSIQQSKISIIEGDLRDADLSSATVIVMYLLAEAVEQLKPRLLDLIVRNNCVVVCNTFSLKGVTPKEIRRCGFSNNVTLYMYDASCLS